jgi:hypothetical protein
VQAGTNDIRGSLGMPSTSPELGVWARFERRRLLETHNTGMNLNESRNFGFENAHSRPSGQGLIEIQPKTRVVVGDFEATVRARTSIG